MSANFSITPLELWRQIGTPSAPMIIDVRPSDSAEASNDLLPGAIVGDPGDVLSRTVANNPELIVVACEKGLAHSQAMVAQLRERGLDASVLAGGYGAWRSAGLPTVDRTAAQRLMPTRPSLWVTRRRPKIDRIACPWLIRRFIDPEARFIFVEPPQVQSVVRETGGVPFDIEGVELSHEGERCSFDTMLRLFGLETEPSLARLALIVRGADTARLDLAPEAAGLLAVSFGLSALAEDDDRGLLQRGFGVYDALFAWLRFASDERHNWPAKAA